MLVISKYLAMDFSPWHPTASPNYCEVSISDINQFCRNPAGRLPLLGLLSICGIVSDSPSDALTGRTWEATLLVLAVAPGHAWTLMMLSSGLAITKLNLCFIGRNHDLISISVSAAHTGVLHYSNPPKPLIHFLLLSFNQFFFLLPAAAKKLPGPICPAN